MFGVSTFRVSRGSGCRVFVVWALCQKIPGFWAILVDPNVFEVRFYRAPLCIQSEGS